MKFTLKFIGCVVLLSALTFALRFFLSEIGAKEYWIGWIVGAATMLVSLMYWFRFGTK